MLVVLLLSLPYQLSTSFIKFYIILTSNTLLHQLLIHFLNFYTMFISILSLNLSSNNLFTIFNFSIKQISFLIHLINNVLDKTLNKRFDLLSS